MKQRLISAVALVASLGAAGCDLAVVNPNSPETERVLALPTDLESLLGAYYKRWNDGLYRNLGNVWGIANVQSFENYSSLANNAQNARAGIPRPANDNSIGNVAQGEQSRVFFVHSEVDRVATNALKKLNGAEWPGFGGTKSRDWRAKSFAEYLRGMSRGYIALFYDSAAVSHEGLCDLCPGDYIGYRNVMDSAFASLQRALDYVDSAAAVGGSDGFPIPAAWLPNTVSMTATNYRAMVRSYRARLRANMARTPTERANDATGSPTSTGTGGGTDWAEVILDAAAGNAGDFKIITNSTTGPFKTWVDQYYAFDNWHQMSPMIMGMGDTTGTYAAYINTALTARGTSGPFFMATPDLRFPQGATRAAQQGDFVIADCDFAATTCERYFRNRPTSGDNVTGLTWGHSQYDNVRWWSWRRKGDAGNARTGAILEMPKSELRLLEAEGHIVLGNLAAAVPLINASRTAGMVGGVATGGGLPAVTVLGVPAPAPGSNNCVPRVPQNAAHAGGGTVVCASTLAAAASLLEALKWEKRVETHFVHFSAWFLDSRRWGDLVETTPLQWAPPYQDLQAREKPLYAIGSGTSGSCAGQGAVGCVAGVSASYGW
jgi:hypothetical protein